MGSSLAYADDPATFPLTAAVKGKGISEADWDAICESGGLSSMARHQIHFARALPGESGVISGMRADAELHVWVDVHRALEDGYVFLEAPNGVLLCDGKPSPSDADVAGGDGTGGRGDGTGGRGDGFLPRKYFTSVIDAKEARTI